MNSCALIISTCRHALSSGRRCLQPSVRGRACCRHRVGAQARSHNMARGRRRSCILRLRVAMTHRDLAWNETEISRVIAPERIDSDSARMMLWALHLSASALREQEALRSRNVQNKASKFNGIYDVPVSPFILQSLRKNPSQLTENTNRKDRGSKPDVPSLYRAKS